MIIYNKVKTEKISSEGFNKKQQCTLMIKIKMLNRGMFTKKIRLFLSMSFSDLIVKIQCLVKTGKYYI